MGQRSRYVDAHVIVGVFQSRQTISSLMKLVTDRAYPETPGEDAYHLSSYLHALIAGLQGGYDPKYKRIVATCKHFAGKPKVCI